MEAEPRRAGRWIPIVYYYLATVVGLIILLIGTVQGLRGLAHAAFPQLSPEVRYTATQSGVLRVGPPPEPELIGPGVERKQVTANSETENKQMFANRIRAARRDAKLEKENQAEVLHSARVRGFGNALEGLVTALVGGPVFFWHLRQARRREPEWMGLTPAAPAEGVQL